LQGLAAVVVLAGYSLLLVALLGGGDSDDDAPPPRQLNALEKQVVSIVSGVDVKAEERGDVADFRKPTGVTARCTRGGEACNIRYSIGLTGRGRILEDQRPMWQRLFTETDVQRATMFVVRDTSAAGVPPKKEDTVSGTALLTTECDRKKAPGVDWRRRHPGELLLKLCDSHYNERGVRKKQETLAPDDPAAAGLDVPAPEEE